MLDSTWWHSSDSWVCIEVGLYKEQRWWLMNACHCHETKRGILLVCRWWAFFLSFSFSFSFLFLFCRFVVDKAKEQKENQPWHQTFLKITQRLNEQFQGLVTMNEAGAKLACFKSYQVLRMKWNRNWQRIKQQPALWTTVGLCAKFRNWPFLKQQLSCFGLRTSLHISKTSSLWLTVGGGTEDYFCTVNPDPWHHCAMQCHC